LREDIGFACIIFDDVKGAIRLMDSMKLIGYGNKITFLDGRLKDYPAHNPLSTDGTREAIIRRGHVLVDSVDLSLIEKYNIAIQEVAKNYNHVIIIDSDEFLVGDWDAFKRLFTWIHEKEKQDVYNLPWYDLSGEYKNPNHAYRLLIDAKNITIQDRHWIYFKDDKRVTSVYFIGGLQLLHDPNIRTEERAKIATKWNKEDQENEEDHLRQKKGWDVGPGHFKVYSCGCMDGYIFYMLDNEKKARDIGRRCLKHKYQEPV